MFVKTETDKKALQRGSDVLSFPEFKSEGGSYVVATDCEWSITVDQKGNQTVSKSCPHCDLTGHLQLAAKTPFFGSRKLTPSGDCGFSHVMQRVLPAMVEDPPLPSSAFWRSRVELMTPTPLTGLDLGSNYQGLKASTLHLLTPMKSEKTKCF